MTRINFCAEFRLRYALAIEFVCPRKRPKAEHSNPVTAMKLGWEYQPVPHSARCGRKSRQLLGMNAANA